MKRLSFIYLFLAVFSGIHFSSAQNFAVATYSNPKCFGDCDGTITFTTSNVQGPFTAVVTNTGSCPNPTLQNSNNNSITISGICGCAATYSFAIYNASMTLVGSMVHQIINYATGPLDINTNTVTATSCSNCCDGNITFTVTGGNQTSPPTYSVDGTFTANVNPLYFTCAGTHTICVKDASECIKCKTFVMPYQGMPTGIEANSSETGIALMPNPFNEMVSVSSDKPMEQVKLNDLAGKEILSMNLNGETQVKVDLGSKHLPAGIYILEVHLKGRHLPERYKVLKTD